MIKIFINRIKSILEVNPNYKWIDSEDRIYSDEELTNKLKIENQLSFWLKNCEIRQAFQNIETELRNNESPSKKLVTWSEIARKANCDRNTLKRTERLGWVSKRREMLCNLIQSLQTENTKVHVIKNEENELKLLSKMLDEAKKEAAKWFLKYEYKMEELSRTQLLLEKQIEVNKQLSIQNSNLLKELNK